MHATLFHPVVSAWFEARFGAPTPAQREAWPAVKAGSHALIAAPTGSGKTLAAFMAAIDDLVRTGLERGLQDQVYVLYVSPLKALSNDIEKNLQEPLLGIAEELRRRLPELPGSQKDLPLMDPPYPSKGLVLPPSSQPSPPKGGEGEQGGREAATVISEDYSFNTRIVGTPERELPFTIRAQVRTGDTPPGDREKMRRKPPHILVTTPESLFILLTSESGRTMLQTVRSVIVDEIHALAGNKRGAHLALSLERLQSLVENSPKNPPGHRLTRIGLSATQKPIDAVARFLLGARDEPCAIIDSGYSRERDLAIEVTGSPLMPVMANEVWQEVYNRLTELIHEHRTTLIFVNNRRLAERAARFLAERIGEDKVTAHHGSLAREHRLHAEQRLKRGELKALVATASLELGIDIGDVDLVCQLGSPRSIAAFLQRVGRSGHAVGGLPKGRLFPLSRDDLVECAALLDAVRRGELDTLRVPAGPVDVLAQHIIAEVAGSEWDEDALFHSLRRAHSYRDLTRAEFDEVIAMLAEGFTTRRGRRSAYLYRDAVNKKLRARKGARIVAVTNAGAIPDQFDYDVIMEPQGQRIGSLNEDFSVESLPGDIVQLGNTSYRILKIERGVVRVEDAHGQPPNIPFWFGEAPGRTDELSVAVSRLRETAEHKLDDGLDNCIEWLVKELNISGQAAVQLAEYLAAARNALTVLPRQTNVVFERFFDEAGDQHIVIHSPFGSRINRAWGLTLRKKFCRKFNFELQAAALEDSIVISLGATHSFPLDEVVHYIKAASVRETLTQAVLAVPLFMTRWRWVAGTALALQRNRNGKRVPAQFQRMDAEDLISVVFPDQLACQDNIVGEREIPDHPLVRQTLNDCLTEAMDIDGLEKLLRAIEAGDVQITCRDLAGASPLAQEILTARPYAFLDDAPAEERRTQAVNARRFMDPAEAAELGRLDPDAIALVREQAWPTAANPDELHDALLRLGYLREDEAGHQKENGLLDWRQHFEPLLAQQRATVFTIPAGKRLWVSAERLPLLQTLFPGAQLEPRIAAAGPAANQAWQPEDALVELLRGRLECLGPVTEIALADSLQLPLNDIRLALRTLESQGFAMQGRFSDGLEESELEWCERGLLARIHRYTLKQLRERVQPVSAADYMRFLFEWQGVAEQDAKPATARMGAGEGALTRALRQLEGFSIPATAWESDVLPGRVDFYTPTDFDRLCGGGHFIWTRLNKTKAPGGPVKATPIAILERQHAPAWLSLTTPVDTGALSSTAQAVLTHLKQHGASFFADLVQHTGLLRTQVETALGELAANGLVNADNYSGLRALIAPAKKRPGFARPANRRSLYGGAPLTGIDQAGRWSLISKPAKPDPETDVGNKNVSRWLSTPYETLEHIAWTLLQRYGVVFRKVLERESLLPPWRELLYVYRRLEARGEIRGGRFVDGFAGEQYALPEVAGALRNQRDKPKTDKLHVVSAADPLNLTGIILPGERIPAVARHRILFKNGLPVAVQTGKEIRFLDSLSEQEQWTARTQLARRQKPAAYVQPGFSVRN
ncbi:MAG TPA: DEAD/DEAH box helicase [Gammaproteobacteria bacterium]